MVYYKRCAHIDTDIYKTLFGTYTSTLGLPIPYMVCKQHLYFA